jgi:transposase
LVVTISLKRKSHVCPKCNSSTDKVLNRYSRTINHGLFIDRKCTVHYHQKRYHCMMCNHSFNESCNLVSKYQKKSIASHIQIMELLLDPHLTFTKVGELLHLSPNTVMDTFIDNLPDIKPVMPRVLCIDEVYLGRNALKKYVAVLMDFESGNIVYIIYGRTRDALHSYFQKISKNQLNQVKYISSDMYEGYRFLKTHYFPTDRLCVDSFHVIQLMLNMYDSQIKSIMNKHHHDSVEYYLLKQKRFLLLKNSSSIDWHKQEYNRKLGHYVYLMKYKQLMFDINSLIQEIYELKELYIDFNRERDRDKVNDRLDFIIKSYASSHNQEVRRVGRTLLKWRQEIVDSFVWFDSQRLSNGPIESRNNTIKLIIRNAARYHNFHHLRAMIIYYINQRKRAGN